MNIGDYSPENIEKAIYCSQIDDPSQNDDAMDFLNKWSQSPSFLETAIFLMQNSNIFNTRFISSTLIKNKIGSYWSLLQIDQKNEIRDSLNIIIFSYEEINNNDNIFYNLIDSLCTITIFDILGNYPNISDLFILQNSANIKVSLIIISNLLDKIDSTDIINDLLRNDLRQYIISDLHEQIISIITNYILDQEYSNYILVILNCMIHWDSIENIINFELFQILASQLLVTKNTCENTIKCFNYLFLLRSDSEIAFSSFSPFLIDSLTKGTFENQTPITLNFHVIQFLINFLGRFFYPLNLTLIYDDREIEKFTSPTVNSLIKTIQDSDFSLLTLHDDLIHLYEVILSIPPESISDDLKTAFWHFWDEILRSIRNEKEDKNSDFKPMMAFFMPFFGEIRISLHNSLISLFCDFDFEVAESVLSSIFFIEKVEYINFLREQPPSPQLCVSISALEFEDEELEKVALIVEEVLQQSSVDQSPEFHACMLFGLSHCYSFFKDNRQLFSQFIEFVFNSITSSENAVSNEASLAFQRIVSRHPELLKSDIQFFIESIIGQSEVFLLNLALKLTKRVFKACMRMFLFADEKDVQNIVCHFFEPVISVLSNPENFDQIFLETTLDVISKSFSFLGTFSLDLIDFFWMPLSQLASALIPNSDTPISIIEKILFASVNIQLNFSYDQISSQIDELFQIMKARAKVEDFFFMYFSYLRSIYEEIDPMYDVLFNELVLPYLKSEETASTELFFMVAEFSPTVVDIEWLSEILIQSLRSLGFDVGNAALEAFTRILDRFSEDQKINFSYNMSSNIIFACIEFVVDLLHKPLFGSLVDVLYQILFLVDFESYEDDSIKKLPDLYKEVIVSALNKFVKEPQKDFFNGFADFLLSLCDSKNEFETAFTNLLFAIKKVTPCDLEFFINGQISRTKRKMPTKIRK